MSETDFERFSKRNAEIEQMKNHNFHTEKVLDSYRTAKMQLLEELMTVACQPEHSANQDNIAKLGITLACQAVQTEVVEETKDGYTLTRLSLVPMTTRERCAADYDRLTAYIREKNKMYIADIIERTAPDANRRLAIFRLYDMKKQQSAEQLQAKNRSINKLFGSRG